jgi:hypothetical protein
MEESPYMDLIKTIEELRREKQRLDRAIASLEGLKGLLAGAATPVRSRRGRKSGMPEGVLEELVIMGLSHLLLGE